MEDKPHKLEGVETGSLKTGKYSIELENGVGVGELEVASESLN